METLDEEILRASVYCGAAASPLASEETKTHIEKVKDKFRPFKTSGHLAIGHDSVCLPLEGNEFSFQRHLDAEPAIVFFDDHPWTAEKAVRIADVRNLGRVLEECSGLEYFMSDEAMTYLIAVNWYVIEGTGSVAERLKEIGGAR